MKKVSQILLVVVLFLSLVLFASCVSTYHVQVFSDNVTALPSTVTQVATTGDGKPIEEKKYEGMFKAEDLETAMEMAKEAGYTKLLSIEYGTNSYFGLIWAIGTKWVIIRCSKE